MIISIPAVAAALFVPAAAADAQTLTLAEARTLPVPVLARRMLGAAGSLYREVSRPGPDAGVTMPGGPPRGLTGIAFAAAPRATRSAGICEAEVAALSLEPVRPPSETDPDPPARVTRLQTVRLYRIVADTNGSDDPRDQGRSDELCARAGPVLAEDGQGQFFGGNAFGTSGLTALHVSFAARALQQAQRLAAAGTIRPACTEAQGFSPEELCGDPARRLSQLSPADISGVGLNRCADAVERICVSVSYTLPGGTTWGGRVLTVRIETGSATADPPPAPLDVRQVTLSGMRWAV
jgi:hypothetical protein